MIVIEQSSRNGLCKVTFELPTEAGARTAHASVETAPTTTPVR